MGDVYTRAFVNTMHHSLVEVQNKTPRDTLHDVEAIASADTLADRLADVRPLTGSDKLAGEKTGRLDEMRH